ncbi:MAG: MBL fold metallo-hydrolase [Dehalococcoidia bacterium]|nr:MBL fold metallo-hydrolase [Dehalococcoidia bacterium]
MTLGFHGGAGTVTGSRFLVETPDLRLLVDCGQFQGLKALRLRNWRRPDFDPRCVQAVLLTHAHIDHSGYLPRLVREGFRGPIYCTPATRDLADILLRDAARLQEEDAEYANRKGFSKHHPALPLFTEHDAEVALSLFEPIAFGRELPLPDGARALFARSGHILGSSVVRLSVAVGGQTTTLVFSGDLGRYDAPLHRDPEPLPACETLILESTYGGRTHGDESLAGRLRRPFRETVERGGLVLIPAFAVARAQLVLLLLAEMMDGGELPSLPIHLDSPMAVDVTRLYERYATEGELDPDMPRRLRRVMGSGRVHLHRSRDESRALNSLAGPRVIVSASGMLSGGRVLHHLERLLPDPRNLIVLTGYQAVGTRGRSLLEGATTLRMHGRDVPVGARHLALDGLSAHADRDDLLRWVRSGPKPRTVFLAHGEPEEAEALAAALAGAGYHAVRPSLGESFAFVPGSGRWASAGRLA